MPEPAQPDRARRSAKSTALMAVPVAGHLLGYLPPAWRHVADPTWPPHARFHAFQSLFLVMGSDTAALIAILGPVRRRERWSLWILLLYLFFVQAGYFAAVAAVPKGRPRGLRFHLLFGTALVMFAVGLARAWRVGTQPPQTCMVPILTKMSCRRPRKGRVRQDRRAAGTR